MRVGWLKRFMTQRWEDLLLLHWTVPQDSLRATLPDDLELDLFEGEAWASVVGFKLTNLRISPLQWIPWSDFWEVNLRTYVRNRQGQKGVWFHSLDSSDLLAVFGARSLYGLSYHYAQIHCSRKPKSMAYHSRRKSFLKTAKAEIFAEFPSGKNNAAPADSPLDRFLLERYRFWARRSFSSVSGDAQVMHRPYDAQELSLARYHGGLFESQGLTEPETGPVVAHYCKGFEVEASAPSWAFAMAGQANQR